MSALTTVLETLSAELLAVIVEQNDNADHLGERQRRLLLLAQEALQQATDDIDRQHAESTELLRLNQTIAKNEARFRQVVEASPNGMVMINAAGLIEMVNTQTERLFGYTRAELLGHPIEMLLPLDYRARHPRLRDQFFDQPVARAMGTGSVLSALKRDGTEFEVEIALNPIETEDGVMVLSAIVDISARVRLEAQLFQSQKMDAIGRVTAGVAHDFNNLLQVLSSSLDLLRDELDQATPAQQWIEVAQRAATRGGELTSRLLAFSRQQMLASQAVPVNTLLQDVRHLVAHLFETKQGENNELVVEPGAAHLAVYADPGQLEAALINLVVNARDAMPGGGRLRISAYETEADPAIVPPGRYVVISVADTGTGMDEATLALACEPFFTTKGVNGTGLGLSMVYGFARQSGGQVNIVSAPGEGTTVELWLPSAGPPQAAAKPAPPANELRGHVLLIDDSPDVLLTVGSFLRQAGLAVTTMANGDVAVEELLKGSRFDALVTDLAMVGMNGLDVLEQAREIDPTMAGILITGFYGPDLHHGFDNVVVLRKPFNRAELIERVRASVETTRKQRNETAPRLQRPYKD
jgi:PAS domain S-box-containing protein